MSHSFQVSATTCAIIDDTSRELVGWRFARGTSLFPTTRPWHDDDPENDAFWGASVHWNAYLEQCVMLLNRAGDEQFGQEGIFDKQAGRVARFFMSGTSTTLVEFRRP